jgi:hypothetical protein
LISNYAMLRPTNKSAIGKLQAYRQPFYKFPREVMPSCNCQLLLNVHIHVISVPEIHCQSIIQAVR